MTSLVLLTVFAVCAVFHQADFFKGSNISKQFRPSYPITKATFMNNTHTLLYPLSQGSPDRCALLFFGLPKHFRDIVLPSIRKHILSVNPSCDVFLHGYNISNTNNPRNGEINVHLHTHEVYLMSEATSIVLDNIEMFESRHNVSQYYQYFPQNRGWNFPVSMHSMLKQWYSIERVWKQMLLNEHNSSTGKLIGHYKRIGFFRSDVLYTNNINVFDGDAVTASFNNLYHYTNDRVFYGIRKYAELWATKRFTYVNHYMQTDFGKKNRLHSESFLYHLMSYWKIPIQFRDICFYRVRATGAISLDDCKILLFPVETMNKWAGMYFNMSS